MSLPPFLHFMLNVFHSRNSIQCQSAKLRNLLNLLLNQFDIIMRHSNPSSPAKMPARLSSQILEHDAGEYDELSLDTIQDLLVHQRLVLEVTEDKAYGMIRQVQAVCDLAAQPIEVLVSSEDVLRLSVIVSIDLVEPCTASSEIFRAGRPVLSATV